MKWLVSVGVCVAIAVMIGGAVLAAQLGVLDELFASAREDAVAGRHERDVDDLVARRLEYGAVVAGRDPTAGLPLPAADEADGSIRVEPTPPAHELLVASASEPPPRIEVDETEHDFGLLDVGQKARHRFQITNSGGSVLRLRSGGTTCKCTLLEMPDGEIPPGETREVEIEFSSDEANDDYRHGAVIWTNDPARPEVHLAVRGRVRHHLGAWPASVLLGDVRRGASARATLTVFSQALEGLEILAVESTVPELEWTIRDATPEELERNQATSGQTLELTYQASMRAGAVRGSLHLQVRMDGDVHSPLGRPLELAISGRVVSDVTFYGQEVWTDGSWVLGKVQHGERVTRIGYVVFRDLLPELEITGVTTRPEWLETHIERDDEPGGRRTRFRVEVTVPPDAPDAVFELDAHGELLLETNHPEHRSVRMKLFLSTYP